MDLKAKLGLYLKKQNHQIDEKSQTELNDLIYEPLNHAYHLSRYLPGKVVESEYGEYFLAEYRYPLQHFHGQIHLGALQEGNLDALTGLLKNPDLVCPDGLENLVFLDTETTGLAGGSGTYAFLVGVGFFEDGEFVLHQYLMEDYHQELAMLQGLYETLQRFTHLVTFNGKSFDWPLMISRFTFNRMREIIQPVHIDLLHPARRYYKKRLESCSLGSLEGEILGFLRENDISGAEVPALFFSYLQEKDGRLLLPVMQHNHWDILSLVTLMSHLLQAYLNPEEILEEAEDLFSAGKIYEDLTQYDQAIRCYCQSLEQNLPTGLNHEILTRLSFLYKRLGMMEDACNIWRRFIASESNLKHFPYIEMAKYFEHKVKDYHQALEMTRQARELLLTQRRFYRNLKFTELLAEVDHRETRLLKKLGVLDHQELPLIE